MERQLDIFNDSRDVALRNDIAQALLRGDWRLAQHGVDTLRAEFGDEPALAPATLLIEHLQWQEVAPSPTVVEASAILELRHRIESLLAPAAADVMGSSDAPAWLARQWRWLAQRARPLPWQADEPQAHAASLCLRAGDWADAADAVRAIASWRRIPQPLLWMTQACWKLQGADPAWPLLAEALWLAPGKAKLLIEHLSDRPLSRLARRFEAEYEPEDELQWAWLPAWALIDQPTLVEVLAGASSDTEVPAVRGFRLVIALMRLERAGRHHDIVEHWRRLKSLDERLFALYMRTR